MEPSPESAETRRRRGRRRAQAAPRQGSGAESRRVQIRQLCRQLRRRRPRLILNDRLHCCNSCRWKIFRESNFEASLALQTLQRRRTALFASSLHHSPCRLPLLHLLTHPFPLPLPLPFPFPRPLLASLSCKFVRFTDSFKCTQFFLCCQKVECGFE